MSKIRRSIGAFVGAMALLAGVVAFATRAADQRPVAAGAPAAARAGAVPAAPAASAAAVAVGAGAVPAVPTGAPQVPEESASVRDDPTVAPDPKQSADNNVSFPNDI